MHLSQTAITASINLQVINQTFQGVESNLTSTLLAGAYGAGSSGLANAASTAATTTSSTAPKTTAAVNQSGAIFAAAVDSIQGNVTTDANGVNPLSFGSVDGSAVGSKSTSSTTSTTSTTATSTTASATSTTATSTTASATSTDPFEAAGRSTYLQSISTSTGSQTPAQTAKNILGGITGYIFAAYQKAHPNLSAKDLANFQQQVTLGVEEGIGDAETKLAGKNQLSASVASEIDTVRTTVLDGLTSFVSTQNAALLAAATKSSSSSSSSSGTSSTTSA